MSYMCDINLSGVVVWQYSYPKPSRQSYSPEIHLNEIQPPMANVVFKDVVAFAKL